MKIFTQIKLVIIGIFLFPFAASYGATQSDGVWLNACVYLANSLTKDINFNFTGQPKIWGIPALTNQTLALKKNDVGLKCILIGNNNYAGSENKLVVGSSDYSGDWTLGYNADNTAYSGSVDFNLTISGNASSITLKNYTNGSVCHTSNLCNATSQTFSDGAALWIIFNLSAK